MNDRLSLTRKDLNIGSYNLPIEEIDIRNFRTPLRTFALCSYADFTDHDGRVKILKSRTGRLGMSKTVRLAKTQDVVVGQTISAKDLLAML